jgi:hypothetical protein
LAVPESRHWREARRATSGGASPGRLFRRPYLGTTLIGICLGAVPVLGGWGSVDWIMTWADQVGSYAGQPEAKAWAQIARSAGGAVGSLIGGWAASLCGRRLSYFLISLGSLGVSQYLFGWLAPGDASFMLWTMVLGMVATIYFGWLPLYLPELFPVAVRSTGAGVCFNFGRYLSAAGVLATGLLKDYFNGNYAHIGQVTSLVFVLGMVVIWFAPDTSQRKLAE